ncbi:MAG: tripartite tricarboxylate transporter permease, partial [Candidatus Rokuibacteriota bacterium]
MVWTIVLANIVTVAACFLLLNQLTRLTHIRGMILIPFMLLLIFVGSYTTNNNTGDLVVTLAFGALGYVMVRHRWPRAPLVLGLVLGDIVERYLWISTARYGLSWLGRPTVIILLLLSAAVVLRPIIQERRGRSAREQVHAA